VPKPKKERTVRQKNSGAKTLEKQVRALEREIAALEQKNAALDAQIEAAATDYQALAGLMQDKEQTEAELSARMDAWETLSLQLEEQG